MPAISITKKALEKFKTINPGLYPARISKIGKGKASKTGSGNMVYEVNVETCTPTEAGLMRNDLLNVPGVEVRDFFNSSPDAAFNIINFVCACKKITPEELFGDSEEMNVELDSCEGEFVIIDVINEAYQGKLRNKVKNYYPASNEKAPF